MSVLATVAITSDAHGAWVTYQGNARHTGHISLQLNIDHFHVAWQSPVATNGVGIKYIAAADGRVFVSGHGTFPLQPQFRALDGRTGLTLWTRTFADAMYPLLPVASVGGPAYANGRVYLPVTNHTPDTYMYAFDAVTGAQAFRAPYGAQWGEYFAPVVFDGTVYGNAGYYGGMWAWDATTGQRQWYNQSLPSYDEWSPAVDSQYAYAYLGGNAPGLYILDRHTGQEVHRIPDPAFAWTGWSMNSAPVLGPDGDVYVINSPGPTGQPGRLICFDTVARTIKWTRNGQFTAFQPSLADGVVYNFVGSILEARDASNGHVLWTWTAPSELKGAPIVTDDHLFVGTAAATYAIDLTAQTSVWSINAAGALAISDQTLYIASPQGVVTAVSLVPEPALCSLVAAAALLGRRRRFRRTGSNSSAC